ncbi:hypothetical protein AXG93_1913s1390 [Marchantia polymorpha subsp. ruderalis]|uniref:Uncharacterized protein n=1 Tax=Marchantia polymorpha subsp. ruderalis TaxID=1480154 RepID=A0A176WIV2_MARPO|nr:hypothetical protein AXG93_1913s1390 [Marchantia polymorpha subsp. ruderalis]
MEWKLLSVTRMALFPPQVRTLIGLQNKTMPSGQLSFRGAAALGAAPTSEEWRAESEADKRGDGRILIGMLSAFGVGWRKEWLGESEARTFWLAGLGARASLGDLP